MKTIVQVVRFDDTGDSCYRMRWPAANIVNQDPSVCVLNVDAEAKERYEYSLNADLLVLFQCSDPDMLPIVAKRRQEGRKTLVEYNDNFYSPQSWSPVANEWSSARLWALYETFMRESDGVIVTGQGLKDLFSAVMTGPIFILQNMLPSAPESLELLFKKKSRMSFGWAGSLGHMADLLAIKPVIEWVLREIPESRFHVMGNQSIPEQLGLPSDRIVFRNWGSMVEYFEFWEPIEVALIPLIDTPYNRCRSDIKVIEVASRGVAPVVTELVPYAELRESGIIDTVGKFPDMAKKVVSLLTDSSLRTAYVDKLFKYIEAERVNDPALDRLNLYRAFMTESSSTYNWPFRGGYHEVIASGRGASESLGKIEEAVKLIKAAKSHEALTLVREVRTANPFISEAWNLEIILIKKSNALEAKTLLEEALIKFPDEIKFKLQRIELSSDKRAELRNLIGFLAPKTEGYRASSRVEVCRYVSQLIAQDTSLIDDAQEVLLLYPFDVGLRFAVGRLLESVGREKEALSQYESLARLKKEAIAGASDIANYDLGFLDAWHQSLRARVKGGLS